MECVLREKFIKRKMVKSKNKSINSEKTYRTNINNFYDFILDLRDEEYSTDEELLNTVTVDEVEKYFYRIEEKNKKSTVNVKVGAIKNLFQYALNRNEIKEDPTKTLELYTATEVIEDTELKETLTIPEMKKVINATYIRTKNEKNFDFNSARDRALISLLCASGQRIDEILLIQLKHIEKTDIGYVINIVDGDRVDKYGNEKRVKNRMSKRIVVPNSIEVYFKEYYYKRLIEKDDNLEGYLFLSRSNTQMLQNAASELINKAIKKAGLGKKITPHSFRHSLTQILEENNVNTSLIHKIIGLTEKTTIGRYNGRADDPKFDKIKFDVCNILANN